jgi:hypothetical protein
MFLGDLTYNQAVRPMYIPNATLDLQETAATESQSNVVTTLKDFIDEYRIVDGNSK